jgi:hypothetical protein
MKTKLNLLAAGIFLAAVMAGYSQPVITNQPQSQTNLVGTTATFWVVATGTEPLAYQWLGGGLVVATLCEDVQVVVIDRQCALRIPFFPLRVPKSPRTGPG